MEEKSYYIRLISEYDPNDKYGYYLLKMMDQYNKSCLKDIDLIEAKEFWSQLNR